MSTGGAPAAADAGDERGPPSSRSRERMADNRFCADEADASFKCLERHAYDRDRCAEAFAAYKECKKRWVRAPPTHTHTVPGARTRTTRGGGSLAGWQPWRRAGRWRQNEARAEVRRKQYYG